MKVILLIGAVVNALGGISILSSMFSTVPYSFPKLPARSAINPNDYLLHRLFTAGTAFCFGSLYLYLYIHPEYAFPFLIFGMALKYWAFLSSLIAYVKSDLPVHLFVSFGLLNLIIALMFSVYLVF